MVRYCVIYDNCNNCAFYTGVVSCLLQSQHCSPNTEYFIPQEEFNELTPNRPTMLILRCTYIIIFFYNNYKLPAEGRFNVNMSCRCMNSHYGDTTILWPSYLHNGISCTRKALLDWIGILVTKSYCFAHFSPPFSSIHQVYFTLRIALPTTVMKAVTCKSQSTNHIS